MDLFSALLSEFWGILSLTVYLWIFGLLTIKNIKQLTNEHRWNWARFFIINIFLTLALSQIAFIVLRFYPNLETDFFSNRDGEVNFNSLAAALTIAYGLMFAAYINSWRILQYVPLFYVSSAVWLYYTTGIFSYMEWFSYIGGTLALGLMLEVGIRLKDNNSTQMGIYLLLEFSLFVFPLPALANHIVILIQQILGILFAYGKLNLFKIDEEKDVAVEYQEPEENKVVEKKETNITVEFNRTLSLDSSMKFAKITLVEEN